MEAEETIINYETYDAIRGYGAPCAYSLMKPYLEHQAEISFKAGEKHIAEIEAKIIFAKINKVSCNLAPTLQFYIRPRLPKRI